jgi:hypothetical protein
MQAVRDACLSPIVREQSRRKVAERMQADAATAMAFLFSTDRSGLDAYALWLNFEPDRFREKLIHSMFSERVSDDLHLKDQQRRNFRINFKIFRTSPVLPIDQEDSDDDDCQPANNLEELT